MPIGPPIGSQIGDRALGQRGAGEYGRRGADRGVGLRLVGRSSRSRPGAQHDDTVEVGRALGRHLTTPFERHLEPVALGLEPVGDHRQALTPRALGGDPHGAAEDLGLLRHGDRMAAAGSNAGELHPGDPAADDQHVARVSSV